MHARRFYNLITTPARISLYSTHLVKPCQQPQQLHQLVCIVYMNHTSTPIQINGCTHSLASYIAGQTIVRTIVVQQQHTRPSLIMMQQLHAWYSNCSTGATFRSQFNTTLTFSAWTPMQERAIFLLIGPIVSSVYGEHRLHPPGTGAWIDWRRRWCLYVIRSYYNYL